MYFLRRLNDEDTSTAIMHANLINFYLKWGKDLIYESMLYNQLYASHFNPN